jgi:hypothetical protein
MNPASRKTTDIRKGVSMVIKSLNSGAVLYTFPQVQGNQYLRKFREAAKAEEISLVVLFKMIFITLYFSLRYNPGNYCKVKKDD